MELLEGTLHHMTQMISNRERGDDIVPTVKAILGNSFHKAAGMEAVEQVWRNQYMVTEKKVPH